LKKRGTWTGPGRHAASRRAGQLVEHQRDCRGSGCDQHIRRRLRGDPLNAHLADRSPGRNQGVHARIRQSCRHCARRLTSPSLNSPEDARGEAARYKASLRLESPQASFRPFDPGLSDCQEGRCLIQFVQQPVIRENMNGAVDSPFCRLGHHSQRYLAHHLREYLSLSSEWTTSLASPPSGYQRD
jgi:hypothetical protein